MTVLHTQNASASAAAEEVVLPALKADPREQDLSPEELDYLFDVRGYRILKGALSAEQLDAMNAFVDAHPARDLEPGQWIGNVETHTYGAEDGVNFQNIMEAGGVFTDLIDHAAWLDQVSRYIVTTQHQLSIDENFLNVRSAGGFIPIHSGGAMSRLTNNFRNQAGRWGVGQINILMALNDVHHGDGCTTIVPGSHKACDDHPAEHAGEGAAWNRNISGAEAVGMCEVHLDAGDALMFTDAICHGSVPRTNDGERRVCIYRYAPHLLAKRMNFLPDFNWLASLTPRQRAMVAPTPLRMAPGRVLRAEDFEHDPVGG